MALDLLISVLFSVILIPKIKFKKAGNEEKLSVDTCGSIKGILCLVIFFNHFTGWFLSQGPVSYILLHCGSQAVAVFFFLSSYGISQKYKNVKLKKDFIIKRFSKLLIPYWLCIVIYSTVSVLAKIQIKTVVNLKNIIVALFALVERSEIVENAWFVTAIAFMYIVYYLCSKILPTVKLSIKVTFVLIIFSVITGGRWIISSFAFPLGIFFAEEENKIREFLNRHYWLAVGLLSFALVTGAAGKFLAQNYNREMFMDLSDMFTSIIISALAYAIIMRVSIGNAITKFLSGISYEVYLLHGLMIRISYMFFGLEKEILFCVTAIALTIAAAIIVNYISKILLKINIIKQ